MNAKIEKVILNTLNALNETIESPVDINGDMTFIGSKTQFDSLDFIRFILELEGQINAEFNTNLTLLSDKAFSRSASPYYNIASLTEYISGLLSEAEGDYK